jgi:hypothetical protein
MGARTQHIARSQDRHKHPGALRHAYEIWGELQEAIQEVERENGSLTVPGLGDNQAVVRIREESVAGDPGHGQPRGIIPGSPGITSGIIARMGSKSKPKAPKSKNQAKRLYR